MTAGQFQGKYSSKIGVMLNWQRLMSERWPIDQRSLTSIGSLARCFAPWYVDQQGREVSLSSPDAIPVRFDDVPRLLPFLAPRHQLGILSYAEVFRHHAERATLTIPAYAVSDSVFVVLDGNHRVAALTLARMDADVHVDVLLGPKEGECLPDLPILMKALG
jgi:hypothetical protein